MQETAATMLLRLKYDNLTQPTLHTYSKSEVLKVQFRVRIQDMTFWYLFLHFLEEESLN